jgi:hypothetical protein
VPALPASPDFALTVPFNRFSHRKTTQVSRALFISYLTTISGNCGIFCR